MATENDYKQAVYYLTKLLNGGLLGEKVVRLSELLSKRVNCKFPNIQSQRGGHRTVALTATKTSEVNAMTDFMRIHDLLFARHVDND